MKTRLDYFTQGNYRNRAQKGFDTKLGLSALLRDEGKKNKTYGP